MIFHYHRFFFLCHFNVKFRGRVIISILTFIFFLGKRYNPKHWTSVFSTDLYSAAFYSYMFINSFYLFIYLFIVFLHSANHVYICFNVINFLIWFAPPEMVTWLHAVSRIQSDHVCAARLVFFFWVSLMMITIFTVVFLIKILYNYQTKILFPDYSTHIKIKWVVTRQKIFFWRKTCSIQWCFCAP